MNTQSNPNPQAMSQAPMSCEELAGIMNFSDEAARFDPKACRIHVMNCEACQRAFPEILILSELGPREDEVLTTKDRGRGSNRPSILPRSVPWVAAGIIAFALVLGAWQVHDMIQPETNLTLAEEAAEDLAAEIPESVLPVQHSLVQVRILSFQQDRSLDSKFEDRMHNSESRRPFVWGEVE